MQTGGTMEAKKVILQKGQGRTLKAGGLWVYDNEIASIEDAIVDGDIVAVHDFDDYFMGYGYINRRSKIRVRLLSRDKQDVIDADFMERRVRTAWEYRKVVTDTSSCRIIFGEADLLPGLVIDKFSDVLVVECLALGMEPWKKIIVEKLRKILEEDGITIRGVYERSDAKVRLQEGLERYKGFWGEPFPTKVEITENGVHYLVDVAEGQKTGFFLDQKYNRLAIQRLCRGKRVLDCFTHTGSFALNAAYGGAAQVIGLEASELAVTQARENALLNHMEDCVQFICGDVFDILPEWEKAKETFDVVILDPPAFAKSKAALKNAVKGYREINLRGMKLLKDGGYLATCSCSHFLDAELFAKTIREAAAGAHKRLRQVEFRTQAPDHPFFWGAEDSFYLKFYIFQVFDYTRVPRSCIDCLQSNA
jgi:23S rRNA (cytosine1962-C5)-methyltransferase